MFSTRIKIINPNTTHAMTDNIYETAKSCARPDTEIIAVSVKHGPASIENYYDQTAAAIGVIEELKRDKPGEFNAYVIAAACEAGLVVARQVTDAPVIGIGEAAMYMANMLSAKFSIVTVVPTIIPLIEEVVVRAGMREKCASIRSTNLSVTDLVKDAKKAIMEELTRESKRAIYEDGAEAICLGCSGMTKFAQDLEDELNAPVFDGVIAAVKLAEALADTGKKTSKINSYNYPSSKPYEGFLSAIEP